VGESDNKGTPKTAAEIAYGRTLPRADADYPIRGYEYYDFLHHVVNTRFVNYQDNATRKAGALSYLLYTSFPISTHNSVEGLKFENAKPVYFPPPERRWSFSGEFNSFSGWNGAVFHDKDGSVGGVADSYIVIDNGFANDDKACELKPTWNAAVCKGDFGRMGINAGGGARGGGAARGAAPAPGAAAGPGAAAPRGGGAGGRGAAAPPIVLSRNGRKYNVSGNTTVRAGTEIKAETEQSPVNISVSELDSGSWVIFELPGFATANAGTPQSSLDALSTPAVPRTTTAMARFGSSLFQPALPAGGRGVVGSIQVSR
jgi:cell migration-inducing and hyaluronan-binding protein